MPAGPRYPQVSFASAVRCSFAVIIPSAAFSGEVDWLQIATKSSSRGRMCTLRSPMGCPTGCRHGYRCEQGAARRNEHHRPGGSLLTSPTSDTAATDRALFTKEERPCRRGHRLHRVPVLVSKSQSLVSAPPALLFHLSRQGRAFPGRMSIAPVAVSMCPDCHDPHSTDFVDLLVRTR